MPTPLLRINDVMAELSIGRSKARGLVWSGELPAVRIGRAVRVRRADLDAFIEANRSARVADRGPVDRRSTRPRPSSEPAGLLALRRSRP
jgi:excisionase family DNA binding protein